MDIRSFTNKSTKDAEIDRLNEDRCECVVCPRCDRTEKECEEQAEDKDNKNPITDWCGGWGLSCDECYYKNHPEEDDDASSETSSQAEERGAFEEGGQDLLDCLLAERKSLGLVKKTDPDEVSAEIVPDSPKKATRSKFVVRGVNTREIYWKIPAEIDLEDEDTYDMGDKWGTLYIKNKKTGQEWELEAKGGEEDFKRCDETHIESYDEHSWWWGDDEEE